MNIPFVDLKAQYASIKTEIDTAIANVISDTSFIGGKYVKNFADAYATYYGVKHVIPCANGTDSLYIIMKMLGIGQGDEVITVANSWVSSSETITQAGALVVFADAHLDYFSIDETKIERLITQKTKAIIAVHLHGQMCAIDKIKIICEKHNLLLIEDCAQSHSSTLNGIKAGMWGIAASFSFFPGKNLGAYGDAGCIITNDDELADKCRMFANHGALVKHFHKIEGINSRLDGMQAAILNAKLPFLDQWISARIRVAAIYNQQLAQVEEIILPKVRPDSKHTYHLFVIRAEQRDKLQQYLEEHGIATAIHYPTPLPFLEAYSYLQHTREDFPITYRHQKEILSLPIYPEMENEMIVYVCDCIKKFYTRYSSSRQVLSIVDEVDKG